MIYLDIESVPCEAALREPYPEASRPAPANYKDPAKIAEWREKDIAAWAAARSKECSLNPRLGRVLAIGFAWDDCDASTAIAKTEAQEKHVLEVFWEEVAKEKGQIVTWNGAWDLRFIVTRSMFHGITPTIRPEVVRSWFRKYSTHPHFDCRAVLTNWEPYKAGEGLDVWSEFFGLDGKADGMSGADVYPLYLAGNFVAIESYCAQDVAATKAVFKKIAPMFAHSEAA